MIVVSCCVYGVGCVGLVKCKCSGVYVSDAAVLVVSVYSQVAHIHVCAVRVMEGVCVCLWVVMAASTLE